MREAQIEKKVVAWAVAHGVYTRKFSSPAHRGVPDRFFGLKGRVCFLEFKMEGKKPTELQSRELALLKSQMIPADWVWSVEQGIAALRLHLWI